MTNEQFEKLLKEMALVIDTLDNIYLLLEQEALKIEK